ncbi:MAG TPA: FAD-dependent oxidoreductase [Methanotrichaceae archaeon]|nr:FAD-dependent oxidoreductase [Methanotrichaceae archaeon]
MAKKVVIVGGGAAGVDVLELLLRGKEKSEDMEITLLKKEKEGFFSMCGLPYALQGMCSLGVLNQFQPDLYRNQGIDFRTETTAKNIDYEGQSVHLESGEELSYDYLVIATGSKPFIPSIPGTDLEGVHTLICSQDGERISAALDAGETSSGLVIGGGMIGLQAAIAFSKRGIKTTVIERLPSLLPNLLDADMSSIVKEYLETDITFILGRTVDSIRGDNAKGGRHVKSVVAGGEEMPADIVLISAGMRPDVGLAKDAGIDIGESGGIVTDRALRAQKGGSHLDNVFALGDCAEVIDAVTFSPRLSQLASTALIQARVVADNILDIGSSYEPCLSPTAANLLGLQVGSVGITTETARRFGIPVKSGTSARFTKARFFPDKKRIIAKLIFEASSERLIGAQIISEETVAGRINELTLGIKEGITARDIWMRERCFDPSLAMVEDVLVDAAMRARTNHLC